ncbi:MAG: NeuD/PglB/VioB family sugar acetyltransferase [Zoogloeaceae bacterium]|jgi:sugar O-acyltransferase (sialic acid O-acetyltransferase NeuD family)|nr:NeuD/PglB/VioB family sugar acetyltransferase [Zoogloeaceae bacterium]
MKRILIVGGGGQGHIIHDVLSRDANLREEGIQIAGFLDTRADLAQPEGLDAAVLGNPLDWKVEADDLYIPAIGNPEWRERLLAPLIAQNARFISYTKEAFIAARTMIGQGVYMTPASVASTDCRIHDFCYIDTYVVIGHDVEIGAYSMISAMTFLAGGVRVGKGVWIHPRSVVAKGVRIGDRAVVGIGSVVVKDVPPDVTVFGNPARVISVREGGA